MIPILILIAFLVLLPIAAVFALDRVWPHTRETPLAFAAGLISPAIIGIALIVAFRRVSQQIPGPDEIDSGGMVLASIMGIGPIMVVASIAVTVPAAMIALRYLRRRAGR
jgi:hypothetical protein